MAIQTVISDSDPFDEVLLREGKITVTSTRLELKNKTYALKYISSVKLSQTHPPRGEALFVLFTSVLAIIALIAYMVTGKITQSSFYVYLSLAVLALVIGAFIYWMDPSKFTLEVKLVSGEKVEIKSKSERYIHRVHRAVSSSLALNRLSPADAAWPGFRGRQPPLNSDYKERGVLDDRNL